MNKVGALSELSLFEGISPSVLEPIASYFLPKRFERGDFLWREGAKAVHFTFILKGQVKVVKTRNDGKETILGVFGEDSAVGHVAVYRQIPYPAAAIALNDVQILEIYRGHFYATIQEHQPLLEALLLNMMRRNEELVHRVHELTVCSAEQRLAMLFSKFVEGMGVRRRLDDGSFGVHIDLPLSRGDIANLINTRIETAIRLMSRWNKEGPIRTEKRGFLVTDPERLEQLANEFDDRV